jgi:IMP dehydrogenase
MSDGGIRTPGDFAKAVGAGASTIMLGSLLAGTKETPFDIIRMGEWPNEQLYKKYRGSASLESKLARGEKNKNVEGNSKLIPYKGSVKRIINDLMDGLQSSMSYVGAHNIKEFHENVEFYEVTNAGILEAQPHLLK